MNREDEAKVKRMTARSKVAYLPKGSSPSWGHFCLPAPQRQRAEKPTAAGDPAVPYRSLPFPAVPRRLTEA
jgi:hypothetical protein